MDTIQQITNKKNIIYNEEQIKVSKPFTDDKLIKKKESVSKETKKKRCTFCNKKLDMINFECKCGGTFCNKHRYSHTHQCNHQELSKKENKTKIEKENPKIKLKTYVGIN